MNVRGVELELHPPPDYVSDVIRLSGDFYEAPILDEIAERIVGGTIVDAGAHIGNHTVFLATFIPRATVVTFEPVPENLGLLLVNTQHLSNVEVHPVALSDRAGRLEIGVSAANSGHAVVGEHLDETIVVDAVPLDSFGLADVSLLKIDVEGHEPQVLAGARATIERCHPLIVIEDWKREYAHLLPGYRLAAEWETLHQTYLYEWP